MWLSFSCYPIRLAHILYEQYILKWQINPTLSFKLAGHRRVSLFSQVQSSSSLKSCVWVGRGRINLIQEAYATRAQSINQMKRQTFASDSIHLTHTEDNHKSDHPTLTQAIPDADANVQSPPRPCPIKLRQSEGVKLLLFLVNFSCLECLFWCFFFFGFNAPTLCSLHFTFT